MNTSNKNNRGSKAAIRKARNARQRHALPNHTLGKALISAYVETGKKFTPGMRRVLGIN